MLELSYLRLASVVQQQSLSHISSRGIDMSCMLELILPTLVEQRLFQSRTSSRGIGKSCMLESSC